MTLTYDDLPRLLNLADFFLDRNLAEGRGDRAALYCGDDVCTFAELAERTNRIGHVLQELGVEPEDRVLLALSDSPAFVAAWFAVVKIGAVVAEVYTFLQPKDYAYYLNYSRAKVVVADEITLPRLRQARTECPALRCILVAGMAGALQPGEASLDELMRNAPTQLNPADTTKDDIALWKFTTGSTGDPKAAVHCQHDPVIAFDGYARQVLGLQLDDIVLPVPKLFFGYARDLTALFNFGVGAAGVIFPERSTPEMLFELIARRRPTILVQVPTMINEMASHPGAGGADLSSVRLATSAGEALPLEIHQKWMRAFGVEVVDGIGSSELYHIYISNRPRHTRSGSLGRLVPGYSAAIVDGDGQPLPAGEVGELWVRGESAALMYWNDHAKSKRTFSGDLVRTGDLFRQDGDGFFWYHGRADDLLKAGGMWVAPVEVENCLMEHAAVLECAVVGHAQAGLVLPWAYVVLAPDIEPRPALADELKDFVKANLSPHKAPRQVRFVQALPKTASGKLDRKALRDQLPAVEARQGELDDNTLLG
jgi:benzoate-CoA ligase family protein